MPSYLRTYPLQCHNNCIVPNKTKQDSASLCLISRENIKTHHTKQVYIPVGLCLLVEGLNGNFSTDRQGLSRLNRDVSGRNLSLYLTYVIGVFLFVEVPMVRVRNLNKQATQVRYKTGLCLVDSLLVKFTN